MRLYGKSAATRIIKGELTRFFEKLEKAGRTKVASFFDTAEFMFQVRSELSTRKNPSRYLNVAELLKNLNGKEIDLYPKIFPLKTKKKFRCSYKVFVRLTETGTFFIFYTGKERNGTWKFFNFLDLQKNEFLSDQFIHSLTANPALGFKKNIKRWSHNLSRGQFSVLSHGFQFFSLLFKNRDFSSILRFLEANKSLFPFLVNRIRTSSLPNKNEFFKSDIYSTWLRDNPDKRGYFSARESWEPGDEEFFKQLQKDFIARVRQEGARGLFTFINFEDLVNNIFENFPTASNKKLILMNLQKVLLQENPFLINKANALNDFKAIKFYRKSGKTFLDTRILSDKSPYFSFHTFELQKTGEEKIILKDLYLHNSGIFLSKLLQKAALSYLIMKTGKIPDYLPPDEKLYFKHIKNITAFQTLGANKKFSSAIRKYINLPGGLKNDRDLLFAYYRFRFYAGKKNPFQVRNDMEKYLPFEDIRSDIFLFREFLVRSQAGACFEAIEKMETLLSPDPIFDLLRGLGFLFYKYKGQYAQFYIKRALKKEINLQYFFLNYTYHCINSLSSTKKRAVIRACKGFVKVFSQNFNIDNSFQKTAAYHFWNKNGFFRTGSSRRRARKKVQPQKRGRAVKGKKRRPYTSTRTGRRDKPGRDLQIRRSSFSFKSLILFLFLFCITAYFSIYTLNGLHSEGLCAEELEYDPIITGRCKVNFLPSGLNFSNSRFTFYPDFIIFKGWKTYVIKISELETVEVKRADTRIKVVFVHKQTSLPRLIEVTPVESENFIAKLNELAQ
ncbi:hypothetical protein ACFL35_07975 [Candidatus Riflebacteria bacterium]